MLQTFVFSLLFCSSEEIIHTPLKISSKQKQTTPLPKKTKNQKTTHLQILALVCFILKDGCLIYCYQISSILLIFTKVGNIQKLQSKFILYKCFPNVRCNQAKTSPFYCVLWKLFLCFEKIHREKLLSLHVFILLIFDDGKRAYSVRTVLAKLWFNCVLYDALLCRYLCEQQHSQGWTTSVLILLQT